jgi:small subunit ribosomal protein S6
MPRTYECMLLVDNEAVRSDWRALKESIAALFAKHAGKTLSARRWDERRLAYPIRQRRRGTYLLTYVEFPPEAIADLRRELDLTENVLRYLLLASEAVPAKEIELSQAEEAAGFTFPEPPSDDQSERESAPAAAAAEEEGEGRADDEVVPVEGERRRRGADSEAQEPVGAKEG